MNTPITTETETSRTVDQNTNLQRSGSGEHFNTDMISTSNTDRSMIWDISVNTDTTIFADTSTTLDTSTILDTYVTLDTSAILDSSTSDEKSTSVDSKTTIYSSSSGLSTSIFPSTTLNKLISRDKSTSFDTTSIAESLSSQNSSIIMESYSILESSIKQDESSSASMTIINTPSSTLFDDIITNIPYDKAAFVTQSSIPELTNNSVTTLELRTFQIQNNDSDISDDLDTDNQYPSNNVVNYTKLSRGNYNHYKVLQTIGFYSSNII